MNASNQPFFRPRTVILRSKITVCELNLPIPVKVLAELIAYRDHYNTVIPSYPWPDEIVECGVRSIIINADSIRPFNRPSNGVASRKTRLGILRRQLKEEPCTVMKMTVSLPLWQKIRAKAKMQEISEMELCLLAIDYHAGLWRLQQRKEAKMGNPMERLEKALAKDHRTRKPLPENDRSTGRISRLRTVGAALGLSHEEIERDIVGPVKGRKGGRGA